MLIFNVDYSRVCVARQYCFIWDNGIELNSWTNELKSKEISFFGFLNQGQISHTGRPSLIILCIFWAKIYPQIMGKYRTIMHKLYWSVPLLCDIYAYKNSLNDLNRIWWNIRKLMLFFVIWIWLVELKCTIYSELSWMSWRFLVFSWLLCIYALKRTI